MIEAAPRPLAGILGPRAGAWVTALHRAEGVVVRTGVTVERDLGDALELADGTRVRVRARAGGDRRARRPRTGWPAAGWTRRASPSTPRAAPGLPGVYAAGDVTGSGHWEAAARGGTAVARALLGRAELPAAPSSFWSDQHGVRLQCVGDPRGAAEHVSHGDLASRSFELDHHLEGRTTAVLLAGRPPSALRAARARLDIPVPTTIARRAA